MPSLTELLRAVDVVEAWQPDDVEISGVAYHSGRVTPGDIFVCIKGYKTDGHRYLPDAVANGAAAVIVEDAFQREFPLPQVRVPDSRLALSALSDAFFGHPSQAIQVIGITATNGKTTTSYMTHAILEQHGLRSGLIGTVKVKIGERSEPAKLTTPESRDLHEIFADMQAAGVSHACMEVSSSALELARVAHVDFDIVTLNNISREHIDFHGSFADYFACKAALIRRAAPGTVAILNLDDPHSSSLVDETQAQVLTYGITHDHGDLWCRDLELSTGRTRFTVELRRPLQVGPAGCEPQAFAVELNIPGLHSVYNAMVAVTAGLACGVPVPAIQQALETFVGVERRFELIYDGEFKVMDDHFANRGNIDMTLATLELMEYERLILVYAIRGQRGPTVNRENAEAIVEWAGRLDMTEMIATRSRSHVTEKDRVTGAELAAFQEVMSSVGMTVHLYDELPGAIDHGIGAAGPGDVVLLAGCQGMDRGAEFALDRLTSLTREQAGSVLDEG